MSKKCDTCHRIVRLPPDAPLCFVCRRTPRPKMTPCPKCHRHIKPAREGQVRIASDAMCSRCWISTPDGKVHHNGYYHRRIGGSWSWTPEMHDGALALLNEGLTYREVGDRLGLTKNAVIGRFHRMGIEVPRSKPRYNGPTTEDRLAALDAKMAAALALSVPRVRAAPIVNKRTSNHAI